MSDTIGVLVVDDQAVIRAGLSMIIANEPDMTMVGEAPDGEKAVDLARNLRPDVVLMDVRMPRMDGIAATAAITVGSEHPAVLVLTTFDDEEYLLGSIRAGAAGFLLKDAEPELLVTAIRSCYRGDSLVDPAMTRHLLARCLEAEQQQAPRPAGAAWAADRIATLSEREREVLIGMASGRSNRELAADFVVGETTVKTHVSNVLTKLGLRSRVQAVVLAYEAGVVSPGDARQIEFDG